MRRIIEDYSRRRHEHGGYEFVFTPHLVEREVVREVGAPVLVRRGHVPADGDGQRHVLRQADELPDALLDLPVASTQLPGAAAATVRAGHRLPLRARRHAARLVAHPRVHPGRQPHLLYARAGSRRDRLAARLRALGVAAPSASTTSRSTCRRRTPTKFVGTDEGWEAATDALRQALDAHGLEYAVKEGDAAFYGPKIDIDVRDAIGRTLAVVDDPVRLQPSRALRPRVRRRRQRTAPADHVAPSPARFDRAVLRRPSRALRGSPADVVGAGPGARAASGDGPRGVRRAGRPTSS